MQQLAEDEAGNVWEVDAQGTPVRFVRGPQQQAGITIGTPDPTAQQLREADLANKRADAANAPVEAAKKQAELRKAIAEADKIEAEIKTGAGDDGQVGRLQALIRQINEVQRLYNSGVGATKGLAGLLDLLPTPSNSQFNTAGAGLEDQAVAAFKVPGMGAQSDADARRIAEANRPYASDFDTTIEQKLGQLRGRVEETLSSLGRPAPKWEGLTPERDDPAASFNPRGPRYMDPGSGGGPSLSNDGTTTVPDPTKAGVAARMNRLLKSGASDEEVMGYAQQVGADPASVEAALSFRRANPGYRGNYDTRDLELTTRRQGFVEGLANDVVQSPLGTAGVMATDAILGNNLDSFSANPELARAGLSGLEMQSPTASFLGTVGGGAVAAGGIQAGLGRLAGAGTGFAANALRNPITADALYGAFSGAGASDGDRATGAALGTGAGIGGGMFGRGLARAGGNALTGVRNAAVDELRTRGIPLTVGQALGGTAKRVEDAMTSVPGIGDMVNARRSEGLQAFNRSAFDEALAPINANTGGEVAERGVSLARNAVSNAYRTALDGVTVQADQPFVTDMRGVFARADALPSTADISPETARFTLDNRVGALFDPNGSLTGRNFQQSLRGLRRDASNVRSRPLGYDFGNVTGAAEDALTGMVQRQAPDVVPQLDAANQAYGRVGIVRDAVNAARNGSRSGEGGMFMPSQLADAASRNARKFGGTQATPDQPFYTLNEAARDVLPSRLPDSGTANRLATIALPGALAGSGAGIGYVGGDTQTGAGAGLGAAALLAAGGTRAGQRALTAALLDRPDQLRRAGDYVLRRQNRLGMFGAGAAPAMIPFYE